MEWATGRLPCHRLSGHIGYHIGYLERTKTNRGQWKVILLAEVIPEVILRIAHLQTRCHMASGFSSREITEGPWSSASNDLFTVVCWQPGMPG